MDVMAERKPPPAPLTDQELEDMYSVYRDSSASSMSYAESAWKVSDDLSDGWLVASCGAGEKGEVFVVCDGVHASMLCGDADADARFIASMPLYFKRLFKEVLRLRELVREPDGGQEEP